MSLNACMLRVHVPNSPMISDIHLLYSAVSQSLMLQHRMIVTIVPSIAQPSDAHVSYGYLT